MDYEGLHQFRWETGTEDEAVVALERVVKTLKTRPDPDAPRRTTYFDTFDRRLSEAGSVLALAETPLGRTVEWSRDGAARRMRVDETPEFAWDLPDGAFRDALGRLVEMRRLLPLVVARLPVPALCVLDKQKKTVARIRLERRTLAGRRTKLYPAIVATPVRGYRAEYARVVALLDELCERAPVQSALAGVDLTPPPSKPKLKLDHDMRTDQAAKAICLELLHIIELNEAGTHDDVDSEFLHDLRVSVRRTRSLLTRLRGVFPKATTDRYLREFKWVQEITGPMRDLDVYLLKMDRYKALLPESVAADLAPLEDLLRRRHRTARRKLARDLDSARFQRIKRSWRAFLEKPVPARTSLPDAARPVLHVASKRIRKILKRVLDVGSAIEDSTPDEELHRLRIDCKKLRYLMEFFRSLYPKAAMTGFIKELKQLQDNLGDFNDLAVQQHALDEFGRQLQTEGVPAPTMLALGRLIETLKKRQAAERMHFSECFERFSSKPNRQTAKRLFRRDRGDG
ncbi:MAG: CYTH and CHAD domain-containing protein [Planctomycetota bacterium]|jgi:CHAD domain-containing protein